MKAILQELTTFEDVLSASQLTQTSMLRPLFLKETFGQFFALDPHSRSLSLFLSEVKVHSSSLIGSGEMSIAVFRL